MRLKILHFTYDHPANPWCGGGGAIRTWAINNILGQHHDITLACGAFHKSLETKFNNNFDNFKVKFLGKANNYIESRLKFIYESTKINTKQYDLIVEDFSSYAPVFPKLDNKQILISILHGYYGIKALRYRKFYGFLSIACENILLPQKSFVITVSKHLENYVNKNTKVKTILPGANIFFENNKIKNFENNFKDTKKNYILFLGRLDIWAKGLDILIKTWAILNKQNHINMPLYLIGGGDLEQIKSLINKENVKNIVLIGRVNHDEAMNFLQNAYFVCMPSRTEGSSLVLCEALALGKAIIVSNIPVFKNSILNYQDGVFFKSQDAQDLANKIKELLDNPDLVKKISQNALIKGKELSWEKSAQEHEDFYFSCINNKFFKV